MHNFIFIVKISAKTIFDHESLFCFWRAALLTRTNSDSAHGPRWGIPSQLLAFLSPPGSFEDGIVTPTSLSTSVTNSSFSALIDSANIRVFRVRHWTQHDVFFN